MRFNFALRIASIPRCTTPSFEVHSRRAGLLFRQAEKDYTGNTERLHFATVSTILSADCWKTPGIELTCWRTLLPGQTNIG